MLDNFYKLSIKHCWGILISCIIGLIIVTPNLFFILGDEYKGIPLMYTDAEDFYLSRINASYNGCIMSCNPFTEAEYKNLPFFDPSISGFILAVPGIIFGISVTNLKIIYEFLLPAILSFLVYTFVYRLTKNKLLSVGGTLYVLLGFNIINSNDFLYLPNIISLIKLQKIEYWDALFYARIVNPTFSSIIFFSYLHILYSSILTPRGKIIIYLGLMYGLSFYIYFYTYMFITAIQITCCIFYLFKKEFLNFKLFLLSTLLGLVVGYPTIIEIIQLTHHSLYSNLYDYGVLKTHMPSITLTGISIAITCSLLYLLYKKWRVGVMQAELLLIIILIVSSFMVKNQHILSGTIVQYFHFDFYYITPIFIILICYILSLIIKNTLMTNIIIVILITIPILNGCIIQYQVYKKYYPGTLLKQQYLPVLTFLNDRIESNTVVIAPELETLVPIYTHLYQIWTRNTELYYLSTNTKKDDSHKIFDQQKYFLWAVNKYGAEYLILSTEQNVKLSNTISILDKKIVYIDKYFIVYEI